MILSQKVISICYFIVLGVFLYSCHDEKKPKEKDIVSRPAKIEERVSDDLKKTLNYAAQNSFIISDSARLQRFHLDSSFYESRQFEPAWSDSGKWVPLTDSLFRFIERSMRYGLFPEDYHYESLAFLRRSLADTLAKKNAMLWTRADLLFTDAFFSLVKDLKQGRIPYDSVTLRNDAVLPDSIFFATMKSAVSIGDVDSALRAVEPKYKAYDSLKIALRNFLSTAKFKPFTYLVYPYSDSVSFFRTLQTRFHELGLVPGDSVQMDTNALATVIKKYQKEKNFKVTGKVSEPLVNQLDNTDVEKFKRIAVTLDRYKQLPDTLPHTYVWVNLPQFYLQVFDNDTVAFESRIIVGAPATRTPLLSSEISNFVTFPQWTVPYSIIFKEMLPKIKVDVNYLKKENLMIVGKDDNVLDPAKINWSKMNKNHFPYQIKQQQGDNNSLGVIKFNFRNKYSVYLHDTNVRWMFGKGFRALSHGCVRVKEWQKLSDFLVRNDTVKYHPDTLRAWIKRQEKHVVSGFQRVPVYLRYFGCSQKNGQIKFYDDIYGEDKLLREKYFGSKAVIE